MKNRIITALASIIVTSSIYAQAPQKMSYQAVVRDASDVLVSNTTVGIQISILQTSAVGTAVFIERHTPTTNANGLATLEIGAGTVVSGNFGTIDWAAGPYFIRTETDPNGGTAYSISGTAQLLSVPYALFAESTAGSSFSGDYNDLTNTPSNVSTFTNDAGYITSPNDADSDPTNEIQSLSLAGQNLTISGGNTVTLPTGGSFSGDYNDLTNTPSNVSTFTNDAGYITNPNDADSDPTNEIQTLTLVGQDLTISGGNMVTLPTGSGGTLDQAYDFGGAGLGRSITTDAGAVQINNSGTNATGLEVNSGVTNSTAVLANVSGIGVGLRAESTNPSNTFAAIQANTNSSGANNSAILGNNSGAGYGVSGQIPSTATGQAGVYGSNLRTTGGYGVLGIGYNGVVGETIYGDGFGIYGSNTGGTGMGIGTYGVGFNGIYGQTTNVALGWSGYFTADIGVEGTGYAVGGWLNASDRRLKSNIVPIQSALSRLSLLQGTHYTITSKSRNSQGEVVESQREQFGVIAQDVEPVFPEMVKEKALFINAGDETLYKTVDYIQLVPVMIEAIKELSAEIEVLKKELEELKKQ